MERRIPEPAGRTPQHVRHFGVYADMYVIAEALKAAGKDLTTARFIDALENLHDYRVSAVASPRTFAQNHHIGNLQVAADGR